MRCPVKYEIYINNEWLLLLHNIWDLLILKILHGIYLFQKVLFCLSEIQIKWGILYSWLLNLSTLQMWNDLSQFLFLSPPAWITIDSLADLLSYKT